MSTKQNYTNEHSINHNFQKKKEINKHLTRLLESR